MLYEKLDYVIAIAEEANLTRAAKKLYISQPTLTMYLNRLEESLGVKLFDRRKNPVTLTEAGKFYIAKMRQISAAENLLRSEIHSVAYPEDSLSIGIGRVRGHHWLPPLLRNLTEKYPNLNIRTVQSSEKELLSKFKEGQINVAIGAFPDSMQRMNDLKIPLFRKRLSKEAILLVAHRKFGLIPKEIRSSFSPDSPYPLNGPQLNGLPFIVPYISNGMYYSFQNMVSLCNLRPGRVITIDNMSTGLSMAAEGLGVQMINASILNTLDSAYQLQDLDFCTLPGILSERFCYLVWPTDSQKTILIENICQILKNDILSRIQYNEVIPDSMSPAEPF